MNSLADEAGTWHDVGEEADFPEGSAWPVSLDGVVIAVFRSGGELYALRDACTHGDARLSDGYVENGCVECPLHQSLFDLRTGIPQCLPATEAVRTFPVQVLQSRVHIKT